jgi:hypothetical protein
MLTPLRGLLFGEHEEDRFFLEYYVDTWRKYFGTLRINLPRVHG